MKTEQREKNKTFLLALMILWSLALTMLAVVTPRLH
jgi:hypothetical protein